jgi:glycosyltransferase involved in cell wall biosynthesis
MHIMHVIDSLAIGGAERMLVDIANRTSKDDIDVSVCITRSDSALARELFPKVKVDVLGRKNTFELDGFRKLAQLVRQNDVSVFHAHGLSSFAFLAVSKKLGIVRSPILFHDHNGSIEFKKDIPAWFRIWGKDQLDKYVGVYQMLASWACKAGVDSEKIAVIENALDLSRISTINMRDIRHDIGVNPDTLIGVVVGNMRPAKGFDVLIDALALSKYNGNVKYLLIGAAQDQAYFHMCRSRAIAMGLGEKIVFLGSRSDTLQIIAAADFALMPSRSESGPLVLVEYLASGLPFVSTDVGAIGRRVAELDLPEFVSPNDVSAFAKALDRLLSLSAKERRIRGQIGQEKAYQYFDINKTILRWYDIYNSLCKMSNS